MPHKRKTHGDTKKHGGDASLLELHHNRPSAFYAISGSHYSQSQPSRTTPAPAAQLSAAKPAQSEKESTMASKPGVVTRATGGATGGGTTAGGSALSGTASKVTAKAKTETNTGLPGATVIDMSSAGSAVVDMAPAGLGAPKALPKSTTVATVKTEVPKAELAKDSKPAPVAAATAASVQGKKGEAKTSHTKVQAPPTAAQANKEAPQDPLDALADILPSADSVAPRQPAFTGPEVTEHGIVEEEAPRCGEREDTLPPGYRFEGLAPVPADAKPKDSHKPMTTDQALDSLSSGFVAAPPSKTKKDAGDSITASSAGPTNFAPPPGKKTQVPPAAPPEAVSPAPPADKKAKRESDDFSLASLLPSAPSKEAAAAVSPPTDKKAKLEKDAPMPLEALNALVETLPEDAPNPEPPKLRPEDIVSEDKLKKEKGVRVGERDDTLPPDYRFNEEELKKLPAPKAEPSMSSGDALDILSGGFVSSSAAPAVRAPVPAPSAPVPAPKPAHPAVEFEVNVEEISALNTLAADFTAPSKAPSGQKSGVPRPAVCPPAPGLTQTDSGDFSLQGALSASTAKKVESSAKPPAADKPEKKAQAAQDAPMPLEALSALMDTLPEDAPKPEPPTLRPEDIVSEDKLKKEKGVRVGERDDTLPPDYRFNEEELKKLPAPKAEPSMSSGDALDILSGGFVSSSAAPAVRAPVPAPSAPVPALPNIAATRSTTVSAPKPTRPAVEFEVKVEDISALNTLAADFTASSKTPSAQKSGVPRPAVCPPAPGLKQTDSGDFSMEGALSASTAKKVESSAKPPAADKPEKKAQAAQDAPMSLEALSALMDTLPEDAPKPELPKLRPEDIVSEDKLKKEKRVRVGERDDTLPPDCRFNEEELKKLPAPKAEPSMSSGDALDILSGGFVSSSAAPAVRAPVPAPSAPVPALPNIAAARSTTVSAPKPTCPAVEFEVKVEDISALNTLAADFTAPSKAPGVQVCPLEEHLTVEALNPSQSMSFDALSALSETLADDTPRPEPPKLKAEDMVSEDKLKKEKGVRVGERDDTLPPDYRFNEEELKKLPAPKAEPSMSSGDALDILSGDFMSSSAAPAVKAPAPAPSAPPVQPSADFALDALAGEFVSSAAAPAVKSACVPMGTTPQPPQPMAGPVLQTLSDTLLPDEKPKKQQAEAPLAANLPSAKTSSDVVATSATKGRKS